MIYTDDQILIAQKSTIRCHTEWQEEKTMNVPLRVKQKIVTDMPIIKLQENYEHEAINIWELKLGLTLWLLSSMTQQQS